MTCAKCDREMDELAAFPGGICLECYRETPEANAPLTVSGLEALTKVWQRR